MSERVSIGVDPGMKGGIVILVRNNIIYQSFANIGRYEIRDTIEDIIKTYTSPLHHHFACIEKVGGFIGEDSGEGNRNIASAHTTFVLGRSYGNLEMALVCARISFTEVPPKQWQKFYGMKRDKGETKSKWKGRLYERAKKLFPDVEFNKELADAILIAHYCRSLKTW